jgi:hypothetical protein
VGSRGLRTPKAEASEFIVTVDSRGRMSTRSDTPESCHSEVCALKTLEILKHGVPKLFVVIDLDRERGPLIPLTSVVNFTSSEFGRLALW